MLRNRPKHLTVNKSDCLTDFERCVRSLTTDNEKTEEKIKGYLACKEQSSQPSVSNNQHHIAREITVMRATVLGSGVAVSAYLSSKLTQMWGLSPQLEVIITGSASALIIASLFAKSNAPCQDEEKTIRNASPTNDIEQSQKKEQTPQRSCSWLKPPGANL